MRRIVPLLALLVTLTAGCAREDDDPVVETTPVETATPAGTYPEMPTETVVLPEAAPAPVQPAPETSEPPLPEQRQTPQPSEKAAPPPP